MRDSLLQAAVGTRVNPHKLERKVKRLIFGAVSDADFCVITPHFGPPYIKLGSGPEKCESQ